VRTFKFRAWHHETKTMIPNRDQHYEGNCFKWVYEGQPVTIMQFTGLLDANGKEIYEGDIFNHKTDKRHPDGGQICGTYGYHAENATVVEWQNGMFYINRESLIDFINFSKLSGHGKEIIGNIYENPELLGK